MDRAPRGFWGRTRQALGSPWPWTGLALGLMATLLAWSVVTRVEGRRIRAMERIQARAVAERLQEKMGDLAEVLRGAAAYLGQQETVRAEAWRAYVASLDVQRACPGNLGLSWVAWTPARPGEGRRPRPGGPLPHLEEGSSAIRFIEPEDPRNEPALGRDMLQEPVRRAAMLQARDAGQVVLSGPVTLYQEVGSSPPVSCVLYAPVFRFGRPLDTVSQRRAALLGWASVPFRVEELLRAALARELRRSEVTLFDGWRPEPSALLVRIGTAATTGPLEHQVNFGERNWTVQVRPNATFYQDVGRRNHLELAVGGVMVSLLLFLLLLVSGAGEARALELASQREEELHREEALFGAVFQHSPLGMAIVESRSGRYLSVNPRLGEILGHSPSILVGTGFQAYTHPDSLDVCLAQVRALQAGAVDEVTLEQRFLHPDGQAVWGRLRMLRLSPGADGAPRHLSLVEDISEVRLREASLQASEARFRALFEGSPDPLSLSRAEDGRLVDVNPAWCRITGIPREEALGKTSGELGAWADPEARQRLLADILKGEFVPPVESTLLARDGCVRRMLLTGRALDLPEGRLILLSGKDATERLAMEQALRESEARLRVLSDQLPGGFLYQYEVDAAGRPTFLYLSGSVEGVCGVRPEDALRDASMLLGQIDPEMLPEYLERERASRAALGPFAIEVRIRRADGQSRWLRLRSTPRAQEHGGVVWEGLATDITESMEGHLALAESEARFRQVVESASDAIYVHDGSGRMLLCNPAASAATGYTREELLELTVADLDQTYQASRDDLVWSGLKKGQQAFLMGRHRRKDGTSFPVEVHLGLLQEEPSRIVLALVRDLTLREEALVQESRARKAESLVLMAGGIAHDFNNLFQALQGNLDMAQAKCPPDGPAGVYLARAEDVLARAIRLSWKMLDFSGHSLVSLAALDLETWLPKVLTALRRELPWCLQSSLRSDPVPAIRGDAEKLAEALRALLENACEAVAPQPCQVHLRLFVDFASDTDTPGHAGIWPLERPSLPATVCLELHDMGPGVPDAQLERITDPFFSSKATGRGLGLSAAVGILRTHRAGLHILNGTEGGLILRLHFPPAGA